MRLHLMIINFSDYQHINHLNLKFVKKNNLQKFGNFIYYQEAKPSNQETNNLIHSQEF